MDTFADDRGPSFDILVAAVLDEEGTVVGWSSAAEELLGRTAEEVCGHTVWDFLLDASSHTAAGATCRAGIPMEGQGCLRHQSGRIIDVCFRVTHLKPSSELLVLVAPTRTVADQVPAAAVPSTLPPQGRMGIGLDETDLNAVRTNIGSGTFGGPFLPPGSRQGEPTGPEYEAAEHQRTRWRMSLSQQAATRIGESLDVTRTSQDFADVLVPALGDLAWVDLAEAVLDGDEPPKVVGGGELQLRRAAVASAAGPWPTALLPSGAAIPPLPDSVDLRRLQHGRAVIVDRMTTVSNLDPEQVQLFIPEHGHSAMVAPLFARGLVLGVAMVWRTDQPDPFDWEDADLLAEIASRAALSVDNARRYTREHIMAATLQRSLLPRRLPQQSALDVAHRYLRAQDDVGGDWFDVIPLPGARVALVVGDVVGHGIHAAATMGRLRTAVHNFATLDLPPDELLACVDELVARIDTDAAAEDESEGITGATCLYAIYDSVTGHCTLARAGHPPPVVIRPDGTVDFPDVPVSPPLGVGSGMPFETAELHLPEGSRLILYTDGLLENRHRDLDTRTDLLHTAVTGQPHLTPEETCRDILDAMLPEGPSDDIALLVARTRLLDPSRVAEWDIPSDPAAVALIRGQCAGQLDAWGLDETAFTTELILSELITNAMRYGTQPIRVRLLHDVSRLICEVYDGSSTSPHLRRAATTDEGGRGLFLVSQYAERWGTRYLPRGKVIWAEQALCNGGAECDIGLAEAASSRRLRCRRRFAEVPGRRLPGDQGQRRLPAHLRRQSRHHDGRGDPGRRADGR